MIIHDKDYDILDFIKPNWENGPWIAGGAALAWYNNQPVETDIDVYFKDQASFDKIHNIFKTENDQNPISPFSMQSSKSKDISIIYKSDNAITIRYKDEWTIQLIRHTFYNTPQDIIDNFDISVCQLVTDGDKNILFGKNTLRDIKSNTLRIEKYRVGCVSRLVKYMAYGYKPVDGTLENIIAIPELNNDFKAGYEEYDY